MASQGLHLSQRLALQQVLAPQLQQSLALLQAPVLELQAMVQQELAQNPVLEEVPPADPARAEELPPLVDPHDPQEPPPDVRYDPATEKPSTAPADDFDAEFQRLVQLDQEWREVFSQTQLAAPRSEEDEERRQFMFDSLVAGTSLQEHLLEQVRLSELNETQRAIAEHIVGNVDERGYLRASLEEIAFGAGVPVEEVARVLKVVQTFNPPGVAARDLRECLLLQLERAGRQNSLEYQIVDRHLETLARHRYPELARALGVDLDTVKAAAERISQLEPRPGREFAAEEQQYVVPEIFVRPNQPEAFYFSAAEIKDPDRLVAAWVPLLNAPPPPPDTGATTGPTAATGGVNGSPGAGLLPPGWVFSPVDPFVRAIWEALSEQTRQRVREYHARPEEATRAALRDALCRDLNRLVGGPSLFERASLSARRFSPETLARGRENPRGISRVKLNRLLLEEAFPFAFVPNTEEDYLVTTNDDILPHLRISHTYKDLMARPDSPEEVRAYIREKIRAGKYLIKSIQQRQQTLLNIGREIVRRQREFMDKGPAHLRPMTMAQVAAAVGVHETTVSRAVAGKYMETPQGVFELRYFFTSGLPTAGGDGAVSNESVKQMILELVSKEDKRKPLSDEEIVRQLGSRGILIARRTVAKYRSELNILPSHLRREY